MAKYKLRSDDYRFIKGGKATQLKVVDEADPDFASQKHKFEAEPVSGTDVEVTEVVRDLGSLSDEFKRINELNRSELRALYTAAKGGPPPESAQKKQLKDVLSIVFNGKKFPEAEKEVFGDAAEADELERLAAEEKAENKRLAEAEKAAKKPVTA